MSLNVIVAAVVALHAAALWGLQQSMSWRHQAPTLIEITAQLIAPPKPAPPAPLAPTPPAPQPVTPPAPKPPKPHLRPPAKPPKPVLHPTPQPAPQPTPPAALPPTVAPAAVTQQAAAPVAAAQPLLAGAPSGPPAQLAATQPTAAPAAATSSSSEAQCPGNPLPPYPALSRRLGEAGQVIVRVLIGVDGRVHDVHLQHSSGYDRLDDTALQAARGWHCQPVVHEGGPQAAWRNAPVDFVLQ